MMLNAIAISLGSGQINAHSKVTQTSMLARPSCHPTFSSLELSSFPQYGTSCDPCACLLSTLLIWVSSMSWEGHLTCHPCSLSTCRRPSFPLDIFPSWNKTFLSSFFTVSLDFTCLLKCPISLAKCRYMLIQTQKFGPNPICGGVGSAQVTLSL
jgi:hypothetical protein